MLRQGVTRVTKYRRKGCENWTVWAHDGAAKIHGLDDKELQLLYESIGKALKTKKTVHPFGDPKQIEQVVLLNTTESE